MFERQSMINAMIVGAQIGYISGDLTTLLSKQINPFKD